MEEHSLEEKVDLENLVTIESIKTQTPEKRSVFETQNPLHMAQQMQDSHGRIGRGDNVINLQL
jgi:hypothetical protein